jgi:hypothetical protein
VPRLMAETLDGLKRRPAAYPEVLATSSEKSEGIDELDRDRTCDHGVTASLLHKTIMRNQLLWSARV